MAKTRPAQRCTKEKRNGERCGNYAVAGGDLCRVHLAPSRVGSVLVQEKMTELNARSIAQRSVYEPSPADHQRLRTRTAMLGIHRLRTLAEAHYEAAKGGDDYAATKYVVYMDRLISLLKVVPAGLEAPDISSVDEALTEIVQIIEGTASAADVPPLRWAEAPREITA